MKKKFLVTATVCALSAVCIFGATACGKDDDGGSGSNVPDVGPSVQVENEAAWNAAFDKTYGSENFTLISCTKISTTVEGRTKTWTESITTYKIGNELYEIFSTDRNENSEQIFNYHYWLTEGDVIYSADYIAPENAWFAGEAESYPSYLQKYYDYSVYTFKNGKYISSFEHESSDSRISRSSTAIKINAQGYYVYRSSENTWTDYYDNAYGGISIASHHSIAEFAFCNIGTTTYTMPEDAKQAIADYKAANN